MRQKSLIEPTNPAKGMEWLSPDGHSPVWRRVWDGKSWLEDLKVAGFPATGLNPDGANLLPDDDDDDEDETDVDTDETDDDETTEDETDERSDTTEIPAGDGKQEPDQGTGSEQRGKREEIQGRRKSGKRKGNARRKG
jgi:hypothetical protein